MQTKNQFIPFQEYLKRENHLKALKKRGFKIIPKKNKFKFVVGVICLSVAIFLNGTGVFLYPISFLLLGITLKDILRYKENLKFKLMGF